MDAKELLEQVNELTVLLTAIDKLVPGRVSEELFTYLEYLPSCPVSAGMLLAALKLSKDVEQVAVSRRRVA